MATTASPQAATKKQYPIASIETCCRCGCAKEACRCCELICFERPDYHCGHLLTDADLSLQVRYVAEKNKLHNRTLHGEGVVCGLKLTCDPECCGHILVHEGYAIDCCGNDIVVCETTPFDVIGALKAKHLIVYAREHDRCEPEREERECDIEQCFYVTICYKEEDADFQTPFQAGCTSGPQDCVPTRVKERFCIEVTDELPRHHSYLDRLEKRMKHCFKLFIDSPVGRLIKKEIRRLKTIINGKAQPARGDKDANCELFCVLRAYFLQQIKQCPDQLECDFEKQVEKLCCPSEAHGDRYGPAMKEAFCQLFELMHRYQYDCVLADLVFACEEPEEDCCVILGCVMVRNGRLVRVGNTPRSYVWSFANFVQVLTSVILTAAAEIRPKCEDTEEDEECREEKCCGVPVDFDCETFLGEFEVSETGRYQAASASLRAMRAVGASLAKSFAFTDSRAIAPTLFSHLNGEQITRLGEGLGISVSMAAQQVELATLNPIQALLSQTLMRRNDQLRAYPGTGAALREVLPDYVADVSPERGSGSSHNELLASLAARDQIIADLRSTITQLTDRVARLEQRPEGPTPPAAPQPEGPPPSPPAPSPGKSPPPPPSSRRSR
jgi:hypothetical protein